MWGWLLQGLLVGWMDPGLLVVVGWALSSCCSQPASPWGSPTVGLRIALVDQPASGGWGGEVGLGRPHPPRQYTAPQQVLSPEACGWAGRCLAETLPTLEGTAAGVTAAAASAYGRRGRAQKGTAPASSAPAHAHPPSCTRPPSHERRRLRACGSWPLDAWWTGGCAGVNLVLTLRAHPRGLPAHPMHPRRGPHLSIYANVTKRAGIEPCRAGSDGWTACAGYPGALLSPEEPKSAPSTPLFFFFFFKSRALGKQVSSC